MKKSLKAEIYLMLITVCWGLTFPLVHRAVQFISPEHFVFERFLLATVIMFPFLWRTFSKTNKLLILGGIALGILNAGTFLPQTISLETISASRAAFLTGSSVLLVPFLSPLFKLGYPKRIHIVTGSLCLLGLYLLTGANLHSLGLGDLWGLLCAICVALTILAIQWLTIRTQEYALLTFYQLFFTAVFTLFFVISKPMTFDWQPYVIATIVFCAVFATVLVLLVQLRFQHYTTVSKAALIFTLEPVFATIFEGLFEHQFPNSLVIIGSALIILSIVISETNGFVDLLKYWQRSEKRLQNLESE